MNKKSIDTGLLIISILFFLGGIWLIFEKERFGWLVVSFFTLGILLVISDIRFQRKQKKMDKGVNEDKEVYLKKIKDTVTVSEDTIAVWKLLLKEQNLDWVLFEHGTMVL